MFVAWRDLGHARGRFVLMASVVALLSVLVTFLAGLTGGLALQNVSAVLALPGDRVVLASPDPGSEVTLADSAVDADQAGAWARTDGVDAVTPLGISQARAVAGDARLAVAVLGADASVGSTHRPGPGEVVVSASAADDLRVHAGDPVTIGGRSLTVAAVEATAWYSHTPAVYTTLADWQAIASGTGQDPGYATALLVDGDADWAAADRAAGTTSTSPLGALTLLPAFRSEIGSLLLIVALLFGISALVVGAFFTVWTLQRSTDLAVLKALGADDRALRRDALGQAGIVLVAGVGAGTALTLLAGTAIRGAVPFLLSPLTSVLPAVLLVALGLVGAALAVRPIASAEPLTALGSAR